MLHVEIDDAPPVLVVDDDVTRQADAYIGLTIALEKLHFFDDAGTRVPSAAT
jgi:hypothetical protein